MSVILGIGPPCGHDPSAALIIDGKIMAAAEEERFIRDKHASGKLALNSIEYCLKMAGLKPSQIDHVAFAWSPEACQRSKWHHAFGMLGTSLKAAQKAITKPRKINKTKMQLVKETLNTSNIPDSTPITYVEHHLAHSSSAYYFSGFEDSAILSIDGSGEFISMLIAEGVNGQIRKIKEIYNPHSLGLFYSTMTEYLGFESDDGEYKVMGMASYGDASKVNLSHMIKKTKSSFEVNNDYIWVVDSKKHRPDKMYSQAMVKDLGPPRKGDSLLEPYNHIAAATQKTLEDIVIGMMEQYLPDSLQRNKSISLAGGCALNVTMNRKIAYHPWVDRIFVQPAANDSGTSLGAAAWVSQQLGEKVEIMKSAYLGPEFTNIEIEKALKSSNLRYKYNDNICEVASNLLAEGEIVSWFQGRMEYGPRALGNRSILGHPAIKGTADKINAQIKFRELWRPFCPSILEEYASDILGTSHPSPFMALSFMVSEKWKSKIPEVVHIDGSARPQTVSADINPRFHQLLNNFRQKTGLPVLINTSLNRRGEPLVCSPEDAIRMFLGCDLNYMGIGDYLVRKE